MCKIKPIRTEAECDAGLARIDLLMNSAPGTPEAAELDLLGDLALLYEYRNEPVFEFEGRALVQFWIEERGWTVAGINELLGDRGDIAAVIDGRQALTPAMAEILYQQLRIPVAAWLRVAGAAPASDGDAGLPIAGLTDADAGELAADFQDAGLRNAGVGVPALAAGAR